MWDVRNLRNLRYQKHAYAKMLQIKTNPDDATGSILKYKTSVNWDVI